MKLTWSANYQDEVTSKYGKKSLIRHWAIHFQTVAACFTSFIAITNLSTDYIRKKTKKNSFKKEKKFRNNKNSAMIISCFSISFHIKTKTTI